MSWTCRVITGRDFKPFVISDEQLITGQNPKSALPAAEKVIEILGKE